MIARLLAAAIGLLTVAPAALADAQNVAPLPSPVASVPAAALPANVDSAALALLDEAQAKMLSIQTLSANCTFFNWYPADPSRHHKARTFGQYIDLRLARPNYSIVTSGILERAAKTPFSPWRIQPVSSVERSDGSSTYLVFSDHSYRQERADQSGRNVRLDAADLLDGFFDASASEAAQVRAAQASGMLLGLHLLGTQVWNGNPCQVVEVVFVPTTPFFADEAKAAPGGRLIETNDFYIGDDLLPHRETQRFNTGWGSFEQSLSNIRVNQPMPAAQFAYKLPADAHPFNDAPPLPVLADGAAAPDFMVQDASGRTVRLSDYKGKTVVLDFWATWCGPCQDAMPRTNAVARSYKGKGVAFLAVNVWDTPAAFKGWLPEHADYDALTFAIDPAATGKDVASAKYKVSGIPTQFVIAPDGKVAASFVGDQGSSDGLEKAIDAATTTQ